MIDVDRLIRKLVFSDKINPAEEKTIKRLIIDQNDYCDDPFTNHISPDKYGAYSMFVMEYGFDDFHDLMPSIFHEFLIEEAPNLDKYVELSYWRGVRGIVIRDCEVFGQLKSILFSAYKQGCDYAKQIWINGAKELYPDCFQALAKLRKIDFEEVIKIAAGTKHLATYSLEDDYSCISEFSAIVVIAEIMGIPIDKDCDYIYSMANLIMSDKEERMRSAIPSKEECTITEESFQYAREFIAQIEKKNPPPENWMSIRNRGYMYLRYATKTQNMTLNYGGLGYNYVHHAFQSREGSPHEYLVTAVAVLHQLWPTKEFTFNEIQLFATIINTDHSYLIQEHLSSLTIDDILGFAPNFLKDFEEEDNAEYENTLRKILPKKEKKPSAEQKAVRNEPKQETSPVIVLKKDASNNEQELLAEIERLRMEVHKKETAFNYLKQLYKDKEGKERQLFELNNKYDLEHAELAELRKYVYSLTEEDIEPESIDLSKAKEELKKYSIVIIGGHPNWVSKLKELFPKWKYVSIKATSTESVNIIDKCNYAYFFTDCISHTTYYRYINVLREKEIPFGYLHSVNIDTTIQQIAADNLTK